jgi:DNA-directed RNA polymerase specialized sigma24 family protein
LAGRLSGELMDDVDQSITVWIRDLKQGNPLAADQLCEKYWTKIAALARKRLGTFPRRVADEEDVAASVLASLCRGAQDGKFPRLTDRDDLWRLLVVLTAHKVCDYYEREGRKKRGGGVLSAGERADALERVLSREPTAESVAIFLEDCQRLLNLLLDREREVAVRKLEGYTNGEIASQLKCSLRTVERRLGIIRSAWSNDSLP